MFTGIVESCGVVRELRCTSSGARLALDAGAVAEGLTLGASVAVNGVCLTVAAVGDGRLSFEIVPETLRCTNLGTLRNGGRVNLERSLRVGDRLDGHFVQGHVDGRATVERVDRSAGEWIIWLRPERHLTQYMIPKGAVALDGVSLTIAAVEGPAFWVALIPTTLERTTLGERKAGDSVNVESDIVTRTVVHALSRISGSDAFNGSELEPARITPELLAGRGFS